MSSLFDPEAKVSAREQFLTETTNRLSSAQPVSRDEISLITARFQALQIGPQRIVWNDLLEKKLPIRNQVTVLMALAETLLWTQPTVADILFVFYAEKRDSDHALAPVLSALREMKLAPLKP